jgi:hypothetical protein
MPRTVNRTNSKSSEPKQNIPPPPRRAPSPAPSPLPSQAPSQAPSMVDTMKQGFSFGVGSSIAHNMVNRIFNSNNKDETPKKNEISNEPKLTNDKIYELYNKCLEKNDNNIDCTIILQNNK